MLTLNKSLICLKFTTICLKFTTTHLKFTTPLKTLVKWWTTKHLSPLWVDWSGRRLDLSFYCTSNLEVSFLCNIGFSFFPILFIFWEGGHCFEVIYIEIFKTFFYFQRRVTDQFSQKLKPPQSILSSPKNFRPGVEACPLNCLYFFLIKILVKDRK
jgi:hypothetical protein